MIETLDTKEKYAEKVREGAVKAAVKYLSALNPETAAEAIRRYQIK